MQSTPSSEQPNDKQRDKQKGLDDLLFGMKILFCVIVFALISALVGVWNGTGADFGTVVLTAAIVVITALQSLFMKFNYDLACWQVRISQRALDIALIEASASTRMADEAFLANLSKRQRKKHERARRQQQKDGPQSDPPPQIEAVSPVPQSAVDTEQRDSKHNAATEDQQRRRNWWKRIVIWQAIFSGVVALCTSAQFWTSYKQWDATEKQFSAMLEANGITTKQLELAQTASAHAEKAIELASLDQRPWFSIENIRIENVAVGEAPVLRCDVTNYGKLPGTITSIAFSVELGERTEAFFADVFAEGSGEGINDLVHHSLPPGVKNPLTIKQLEALTAESFKEITELKTAIYVLGNIYYDIPTEPNVGPELRFRTECIGRYEPAEGRIDIHYNYMH